MKPILLIHGYGSEGKDNTVADIYGSLPDKLRDHYGHGAVSELNLSRWISLNDGVSLDDVSFAMDRALRSTKYKHLLETEFHVIIHSTGALVVRNWIRLYSKQPSPIANLIHLAGANFGSGLAHIGRGQLSRWGRLIFGGTDRGLKILNELEFGAWKTLDMHVDFLKDGNNIYDDYKVQEFCLNGSQTLSALRLVPIRYVKEDSSDNTVRTSACNLNLNFNYIAVSPTDAAQSLTEKECNNIIESRLNNEVIDDRFYISDLSCLSENKRNVPFSVVFETAHFGSDIGIVSGDKNRNVVLPLIYAALDTPYNEEAYQQTAMVFDKATDHTFEEAKKLNSSLVEWDKQSQYEGHAQLIFRLVDQFGSPVENFDITFNTVKYAESQPRLEKMIEDQHGNKKDKGAITFYLRTQSYDKGNKKWLELLDTVADVDIEITAYEALTSDILYLPVRVHLDGNAIQQVIQSFRTTIIDVELVRLPSGNVFEINPV